MTIYVGQRITPNHRRGGIRVVERIELDTTGNPAIVWWRYASEPKKSARAMPYVEWQRYANLCVEVGLPPGMDGDYATIRTVKGERERRPCNKAGGEQ